MTPKQREAKQKFAGETHPSMLRRSDEHDYSSKCFYLVTLTVEGRRPLLGRVTGKGDAPDDSAEAPRVELSPLGQAVAQEWANISLKFPQVAIIAQQVMPDHFHGILYFRESTDFHLGRIIRGFKTGTTRAYKELHPSFVDPSSLAATQSQHTEKAATSYPEKAPSHRTPTGLLWSHGYNDRILHTYHVLETWKNYLHDNPRRFLIRHEHPDFFRVRFGLTIASQTYAAIGNQLLLSHPDKLQVQLSRRLTDDEIEKQKVHFLSAARQGAVLVSPAISKGEQAVMRAALNAHLPLIFLTPWGFNTFSKPGHQYYEACANGHLLILAPWEHQNQRIPLTRGMCLSLNQMTKEICEVTYKWQHSN